MTGRCSLRDFFLASAERDFCFVLSGDAIIGLAQWRAPVDSGVSFRFFQRRVERFLLEVVFQRREEVSLNTVNSSGSISNPAFSPFSHPRQSRRRRSFLDKAKVLPSKPPAGDSKHLYKKRFIQFIVPEARRGIGIWICNCILGFAHSGVHFISIEVPSPRPSPPRFRSLNITSSPSKPPPP